MTDASNPREMIGGNNPPLARNIALEENFAESVSAWLREDFAACPTETTALLEEARLLPNPIDSDDTKGRYTGLIKRLRDHAKKLGAFHEKEATPYMRGKQAVDQFFFGLIDKVARRDKKNNPGAADILAQRLTDYDTKLLLAEQERRRQEADRLAREEAARVQEATRLQIEAEAKRLLAERARKPEFVDSKTAAAREAEAQASAAAVDAAVASGRAEEAHISTLARPADIMRTRSSEGTLSTMAREAYAEIEDESLLDKSVLWPFISLEAKEKAVRAWAKTHGHSKQMPGARVGHRPKSVVR